MTHRRWHGVAGGSGGTTSSSLWTCKYGAQISVTKDSTGDWFNIPSSIQGVHYVVQRQSGASIEGKTIRLRFRLDLNGELWPSEYPDDPLPCKIQLFFQKNGDRLTSQEQDKRWWCVTKTELKNGEFVVEEVVEPSRWTQVFGRLGTSRLSGWNSCLADIGNVGFTFSGWSFGGHGVYCKSGAAKFTILEYTIA